MAGVVTLAVVGWMLTNLGPGWWPEEFEGLGVVESAEVDAAGAGLENAIVSQLTMVRRQDAELTARERAYRSEEWSVAVSDADMNAWLATRLARWVESRGLMKSWPRDLESVRVRTTEEEMTLGLRFLNENGEKKYVTLGCRVWIGEEGALWVKATWVNFGKLPIPAGVALSRFHASREKYLPAEVLDGAEVEGVVRALRGEIPAMKRSLVRVDGARRVRVLGIEMREGRVEVRCRTETR